MPARPNWCRTVCSPTESLKGNFTFNYVSYLLIVSPFSNPRVIRKPEKSEHKLLQPASPVSHEQPSYGRWTSHPLTPPIFASEIIQLFHSFHPHSSVFCLRDQSWQQPRKEVNKSEAGLCLFHQHLLTKQKKLDGRKDVCDGLFYDWSLKKKINSPQLFINSRMVFIRRVVV